MTHIALPPMDAIAPVRPRPLPPAERPRPSIPMTPAPKPPVEAAAMPTTGFTHEGKHLYLVKIALGDTGYSGFTLFSHAQEFQQHEFNTMLAEAAKVVLESKTAPRRKALIGEPIEQPVKINQESFGLDAEFFEIVMMDKFGFNLLRTFTGNAVLEPTIRGVK